MSRCCKFFNKHKYASLLILLFIIGTASITYANLFDDFAFKTNEQYQKILVKRVISADKIELENEERIRLIGIKAPQPPKKDRNKEIERDKFGFVIEQASPLISMEEKAFDFAKSLLEGQFVRLEFDDQKTSEKHETLAYVFRYDDDLFVNAEILRQGFATLHIRIPNTKHKKALREAYREARREKRGLLGEY